MSKVKVKIVLQTRVRYSTTVEMDINNFYRIERNLDGGREEYKEARDELFDMVDSRNDWDGEEVEDIESFGIEE